MESYSSSHVERLIFDSDDYRQILFEKISKSRKEISISTYILESDVFGIEVLRMLEEKSKQGVKIKMIVDGYGSLSWIKQNQERIGNRDFEIHVYHPLPWPFSAFRLPKKIRSQRFFKRLSHANRRNHQKLYIFDRSEVIIGSRNIHQMALEWRESNVLVSGPAVEEFTAIFDEIWRQTHRTLFKLVHRKKRYQVFEKFTHAFSNHLFLLRRKIRLLIFRKISTAQKKIYMTTPYFLPPEKLIRYLCDRAKKGVDVSILLSRVSDIAISKWGAQLYYNQLLKSGVKIYEYDPKVLHAKSIIVDDWVFVGSTNLNRRSFRRDLELDYVVDERGSIEGFQRQFLIDLENSTRIETDPGLFSIRHVFVSLLVRLFPSWF